MKPPRKRKNSVFGMRAPKYEMGQLVEPSGSVRKRLGFEVAIVVAVLAYGFKIEANTLKSPQYRYAVVDSAGRESVVLEIEIVGSSRNM